jgi:hypothetical protein
MKGDRNMIRTVKRGQDFSGLHDSYCRCQACKPPYPGQSNRTSMIATVIGLALLVLAIVVTL